MGKISWRGSRLVSATIARMAGEVRRRRGRVLTAFTPLEKVLAKCGFPSSKSATCPHYLA
jgi:hypothetical protein